MSVPGWYPNRAGDAWCYWDGVRSLAPGEESAATAAPQQRPGWYHAADEVHLWRWWDGTGFTHTARYGRPSKPPTSEVYTGGHVVVADHNRYGPAARPLLRSARSSASPRTDAPHLLGRRQHHRRRLALVNMAVVATSVFLLEGLPDGGTAIDPSVLVFPGVAAIGVFFWAWDRRALIVDTPTVEVSGAHPARCEVHGEVSALGTAVHGWVSDTPAVRTRTTVRVTIGRGGSRRTYDALRVESGAALALVTDPSGSLRVDLAESNQRALWITTADQQITRPAGYKGDWRIVEECIVENTELWCSGPLHVGMDGRPIMSRTDPVNPARSAPGPFWTSYLGEARMVAGLTAIALCTAVLAAVCLGVATGFGAVHEQLEDDSAIYLWYRREGIGGPVLGVLGTLGVLLAAGTSWRLWNRLVALRQQAEMAWANIETTVARRHDLVPRLAAAFGEAMRYERSATEAVASTRTQDLANADSAALVALIEAHPELRTAEQAVHIIDELVAVESQIAAHRRFYNDAVTLLATRSQTWPGLVFAPLLRSWTRRELFGFTDATGETADAAEHDR